MEARARWLASFGVLGAVGAFASCRSPTDITFQVSTDLPCADLGSTAITVGPPGALEDLDPTTSTKQCADDGTIGTLVVLQSGADDERVAIRIVSGYQKLAESCASTGYAGCIVARRTLRFVPHGELKVLVTMDRECLGIPCSPDET